MRTYKTITVTVSNPGSGNRYYFDTVLTPTLGFFRQRKYVFDQSDATNNTHQLYFSETKDGTHTIENGYVVGRVYVHGIDYFLDGVQVHPDVYKDNTTFNAATTREVHWRVADDTPPKMYPVCHNHPGMYADGHLDLDPTDLALQGLIDRVNANASTATPLELSNLAKTLNNVESTMSDQQMDWGSRVHEKGDAGPEVTWSARDAEFVVWGARHHHSHDGGGPETYDSMLDIVNLRKYMGFHCYDGTDDGYQHQGWHTRQLHYHGNCNWFYRTTDTSNTSQCYANGSDKVSEIGHHNLNIGVDGAPAHFYSCHNNFSRTIDGMRTDSWEVRDNRYYVCNDGNQLLLKDRWYSGMEGNAAPSSMKNVGFGNGQVSASSYNRKRKEAVFVTRAHALYNRRWGFGSTISQFDDEHSPAGMENNGYNELGAYDQSAMKFLVFHNVPYITGNTNLAKVLDDNDRDMYFSNWLYGQSWYGNFKCVLTDDGTIFAVACGQSAYYVCARFDRTKDGRAMRYEGVGTQYAPSSRNYMQDAGSKSTGVRVIQSRNKRNVVMYGNHYEYSSGSCGWVVTRDFNRAQGDPCHNSLNAYGVQIMPFRDGDFYAHVSMDHNYTSDSQRGSISIIHQDGRGWFRRYSVGMMTDGVGHTTQFATAVPIHHDGLNY